jgi:hypothetical protein
LQRAALVGGLSFRQSVNDLCRGFLLGLAEISRMPILPLNRIPASGFRLPASGFRTLHI